VKTWAKAEEIEELMQEGFVIYIWNVHIGIA
jgi:hypothetical protein